MDQPRPIAADPAPDASRLRDQPLEGLEFMAHSVVDVFWAVNKTDVKAIEVLKSRYTPELVERLMKLLAGMQDPVMLGAAKQWIAALSSALDKPSRSFFAKRRKRDELLALLTNSRVKPQENADG
jgi:hypothetical protein